MCPARMVKQSWGYAMLAPGSLCASIAWSMASRRVIARPRPHCSSNVTSPTRERRSPTFDVGSGHAELVGAAVPAISRSSAAWA